MNTEKQHIHILFSGSVTQQAGSTQTLNTTTHTCTFLT